MKNKKVLEQIKHCGNRDWRLAIEDIEKDIKVLMDFINDLKEENKKQKGILDILKHLVEIIPNNATDSKSLLNIRIKPFHMIDDRILLEIKEWLNEE